MVGSLIVTALASAGGALVTAAGALTALGAAAAIAINFVVSTIINRAFAPKLDSNQTTNNREQVPPTTDNSIPVVYGDAYLGGTFVDACLSTNQKVMYYVLAISNISPNGQFTYDTTKFYYGGRLVTFDGTDLTKVASLTDDAGNVTTEINGRIYISLYTSNTSGTITGVNTGYMPWEVMGASSPAALYNDNKVPSAQQWPSTGRRMNGLAFAIVTLVYDANVGTTSLQPLTFKVKHALNGTGVAKPGDVWYDYMTNAVYGAAVDSGYVDSGSATTLNTYSDQTISFTPYSGGSSTQARYRVNGVLSGNVSSLDNVDKILVACDSWMTYNAASGKWAIIVNKPESAAFAFDDTNIVGPIRVSATDITQSVNQIEAKFPFKENKDQANFVLLNTPSNLLYPNEPVNKMSVTYDLVNDSVQAQYLANRVIEQAREDLIVSFDTTYFGIQVDAGDVVSVTNSDYGWSAKLFRVMKVNEVSLPDGSLGARLELNEYSSGVYDDLPITQYSPVPNSGISSPQYFATPSAPTVIASRPSATVPSFDVQATTPSVGRVTYIILYATTTVTPTTSDYKEIARQTLIDGLPFNNSSTFNFLNLSLPSGTYYFSILVGNELGASAKSPQSGAFAWAPLATSSTPQTATAVVYKWTNTAPAIPTGTTTFTWSTQSFLPPTGWTLVPGTSPGATYVLLSATIDLSALLSDLTTTIDWSKSRLLLLETTNVSPYSPRIAFARVAGAVTQTFGTITTSGASSFPSSAQSLSTWGFSATWTATDPDPASVNALYRTDGTYDSNTGNIVWSTPYIASLRTGTLSAITTETGTLNVSGDITVGTTGSIKGGQTGYDTGTGFFLGYSSSLYKFSIGDQPFGNANPTTDTITTTAAHNLIEKQPIKFLSVGSITGITVGQIYYVKVTSSTTFQLYFNSNTTVVMNLGGTASVVQFVGQSLTWNGAGVLSVFGSGITGSKFQTSDSGNRLVIDAGFPGIKIYDSSNNVITTVGGAYGNIYAQSTVTYGPALHGRGDGNNGDAVYGYASGTGYGVYGVSVSSESVRGQSATAGGSNHAVRGINNNGAGAGVNTAGLIGAANGYDFYADGGGTNYGPFTGNHDLLLPINESLTPGDLVIDAELIAKNGWSNTIYRVEKSSQPNQAGVRGVFIGILRPLSSVKPPVFIDHWEEIDGRTVPVMTTQYDAIKDDYWFGSMSCLGEGQMNVCGENGDIDMDTLIVSSSTPGVGMAQSDDVVRGKTVAKARQAVTFSSPTEIKQIACIYLGG